MSEATHGMTAFQCVKNVLAGEITEVVSAGCYVRRHDGSSVLRLYEPKMTERYTPVVGDFWVIYSDGYQSISPRKPFIEGYSEILGEPA